MVKSNRFVKITSSRGHSLRGPLKGRAIRMIAIDEEIVDKFKGYVLSVHIGFKSPRKISITHDPGHDPHSLFEPVSAMILHSDMESFCDALNDVQLHDSGFVNKVRISITMAPVLDLVQGKDTSPTFASFFTKQTQETLLKPLMAKLYGYKSVEINGHVDDTLVIAVRQSLAEDRYSNPATVLADFAAEKDRYTRIFKDNNIQEACMGWQDTVYELDKLHQSDSWPNLVRRGGDEFVSQIVPLYFLMQLNIAHIQIGNMQTFAFGSEMLAEGALISALRSTKEGFWKSGYKFRPSAQHLAKLRYRYALFMRLEGNPQNADRALKHIDAALRLQPGDAALMRERETILAWIQQL